MKKLIVVITLAMLLLVAFQTVCYASPSFAFNIGNTGRTFTADDDCVNTKTIADSPCTFFIDSLSNVEGVGVKVVGMNHYWYIGWSWVKTTNESGWISSRPSGRIQLAYLSEWASQTDIPYSPGARIDDDHDGPTSIGGRFNADSATS